MHDNCLFAFLLIVLSEIVIWRTYSRCEFDKAFVVLSGKIIGWGFLLPTRNVRSDLVDCAEGLYLCLGVTRMPTEKQRIPSVRTGSSSSVGSAGTRAYNHRRVRVLEQVVYRKYRFVSRAARSLVFMWVRGEAYAAAGMASG